MAKVLVLGKGGREHAIVKKLAQSEKVNEIHVYPGNYGTAQEPKTTNISDVKLKNYDLVVVGPEEALANGVADQCNEVNVPCFGPTQHCAQIESSKLYAKLLMEELDIPTAEYIVPCDEKQIRNLANPNEFSVVKKDGLCSGKGVYMTKNKQEMIKKSVDLIESGEKFLLEKRLYGQEITVMAFTDGKTVRMMPPVKDYKRLLDGDKGPNTGSMGSYCPAFNILPKESLMGFVKKAVMQKVVDYFDGNYVGILYAGLMITGDGIKVLEFNARFGDSECQVVLPNLKNDLFDVMMACCNQTLHNHKLEWDDKHCVIVNVAAPGYPNKPLTGFPLRGIPDIYASVNEQKYSCGGRIFGSIGRQSTLKAASEEAYKKVEGVKHPDLQYRTDIGWVQRPKRVVVLGSTQGTDLGYLYEYIERGKLNAEIIAVISNNAGAYIMKRAYDKGTPTFKIDNNQKLAEVLERLEFDLIALIGYMRIIPNEIVEKYPNMINIHPSLLPAFAGGMDLDVHQAVLESGVKYSGCTVHQVTEVVDGGKILVQKVCPILPDETKETLKSKVQLLEGWALKEAIELLPYQELDERKYSVDIEGGNEVVERIRKQVEKTYNSSVISPWGAFAGCFDLSCLKDYKEPVLVSSVDSVGSKILLSQKYGHLNYIGYDLVHHCINDILVMGAKPLFFLDYVAAAKLKPDDMVQIVSGVAHACAEQKVALIGGETAEIKEMFKKDATDLVGIIVGVVEKSEMITGEKIQEGDIVFGISSSGFHTNGYTLVNKYATDEKVDELLEPHRCYLFDINYRTHGGVHGLVHITGGGWFDNPKRVLPKNLAMEINKENWIVPRQFRWIQKEANISEHEMFKTFNMGIGMLVIVSAERAEHYGHFLQLGKIKKRDYYPVELK